MNHDLAATKASQQGQLTETDDDLTFTTRSGSSPRQTNDAPQAVSA